MDITKGEIKTDFQGEEFHFYKKIPKKIVLHHNNMIRDAWKIYDESRRIKIKET